MSKSLFLSQVGAAKVLGISRQTLSEAISLGQVPTVQIGKRQMISRAALLRLAGGSGGLVSGSPRTMATRACIRCGKPFQVWVQALKKPSRCPEHRSGWDSKPKSSDSAYVSPEYRRNRLTAIEREPECHWRLPGCTRRSTQADHVVAVSRGGTNDLGNLVGSCESCNRRRGIALGNQTKRRRQQ